jgi:tetratricopeptide (TPR) repeat protein
MYRARQFFEQGKKDLEAEKWASAASNFKLAQSYGMRDHVLDALQERAQKEASKSSAAQFVKQADYAASVGDKKIAADLYDRAAQAEPTPENLHRAALALLRSHGDLHRAQDYAMRATQADPENVEYRMTLGLVYESAGLLRNALREMQAVQAVAPKTPGLREQIQSLKKRL